MKSAARLLLFAILATLPAMATGHLLTSKEGRFTVLFPDSVPIPQPEVQIVGPLKITMFVANMKTSDIVISFNDNTAGAKAASDPQKMLTETRDGVLKNISGTTTSDDPLNFHGNPARSFTFLAHTHGMTLYGRATVILVKNRLYQLQYFSTRQADLARPEIKAFFSSFTLLK